MLNNSEWANLRKLFQGRYVVISSQHDCYKFPTIFLGHKVISILPQQERGILHFYFFNPLETFYSSSFTPMS
jgi:hypothetical protein